MYVAKNTLRGESVFCPPWAGKKRGSERSPLLRYPNGILSVWITQENNLSVFSDRLFFILYPESSKRPTGRKLEDTVMERFDMRYVRGHVEVFDWRGEFCFSADSMAEAMEELREQSAA